MADADWLSRKNAVIAAGGVAYGFDNQPEVDDNYTNGSSGKKGFYDTSTKIGSGGSLRLDLSAGANDAQLTGHWNKTASPWTFGRGYGEGDTLYLQYRSRITTTMNTNLNEWDSTWKQLIINMNNSTCGALDLVLTHPEPSTIYTNCSSPHMYTNSTSPLWDETGDNSHLYQQQDWDIESGGPSWGHKSHGYFINRGQSVADPNALWTQKPNKWTTINLTVRIGTLYDNRSGQVSDSDVILDIQEEGEAFWTRVVACRIALENNSSHSDVLNNLQLTAFMTGLTTGASQDASVWYDQLLISPSPIALPSTSLT